MFMEDFDKALGRCGALFVEGFAELEGFFLNGLGGVAGGFGDDEIDLDVDVAGVAGGAAKFFEQAAGFAGGLVVWRQGGEEFEQHELGFDAAGAGAKAVDRFGSGVGETEGDGGFKSGDVLAQGADGMRDGGGWHGCWMPVRAGG